MACLILPCLAARAATDVASDQVQGEAIILEAVVNGVAKGDCMTVLAEGQQQRVWVAAECIAEWGVASAALPTATREEERYARLDASEKLQIRIDLDQLSLSVQFAPEAFAAQSVDLGQSAHDALSPSAGANAFLDYGLAARWASGSPIGYSGNFAFTGSIGNWAARSEHSMVWQAGKSEQRRIRSFAQLDWPESMNRLAIGDVESGGGSLSQIGSLGGVRFSREFETRPGFVSTPTFNYLGAMTGPATVEVFVDGTRVRTVALQPGRYELQNLRYFAGARQIDLVVVDSFGNRQTTSLPFYFADGNLGRGLQEFSYAVGKQRLSLGPDNAYGDLGFAGHHRVGVTDSITLGATAEWLPHYQLVGADAALRLGRWGTLDASVARSAADGGLDGVAVQGTYGYSNDGLSLVASYFRQDRNFGLPSDVGSGNLSPFRVQSQMSFGFAQAFGSGQSLGINHSRASAFVGPGSVSSSLRYSVRLGKMSLSANLGVRNEGEARGIDGALVFSMDLGPNLGATLQLDARKGGGMHEQLTLDRSTPLDSGWSGRLGLERAGNDTRMEAFWQQPTNVGQWSAAARVDAGSEGGTSTGAELRYAGSLATIGGSFFATRPIYESFAMVDTNGLAGVRVYQNNQLVGRTRKDGRLLVPSVAAYASNQLRVDDRDIPLEISLAQVEQSVVPRIYSGVIANFKAKRIAAVAGVLVATIDGKEIPVRAAALATSIGGQPVESSTGPDGDFYLEDLLPGSYALHASNAQLECTASFLLAEPLQTFADLGKLACAPSGGA